MDDSGWVVGSGNHYEGENPPKRGRQTPSVPKPGTKKHPTMVEIEEDAAYLRKLRGQGTLQEREAIVIVYTYLQLKKQHQENRRRSGGARKNGRIAERTATLLGYAVSTVRSTFARWNRLKEEHGREGIIRLSIQNRRGKATKLPTRIPTTKRVYREVRDFVRGEREAERRVTAVQVLEFLQRRGFVRSGRSALGFEDDERHRESALRAVQRFLDRAGYRRGRKQVIRPSPETTKLLARYLHEIYDNRAAPAHKQLREVYLDESYIDQNYNCPDTSQYDPSNDKDDETQHKIHRGRRYCFALAIQGPDPTKSNDDAAETCALAGPVPNTSWIFDPGSAAQRGRRRQEQEQQQEQQQQKQQQQQEEGQQQQQEASLRVIRLPQTDGAGDEPEPLWLPSSRHTLVVQQQEQQNDGDDDDDDDDEQHQQQKKGREPPSNTRKCGRCGRPGHTRRKCSVPEEELPPPPSQTATKRKCGRCGQPGHTRRKCSVPEEGLPPPPPKKGRRRRQRGQWHTGDYHKAFNSENFISWMKEAVLPNLKQRSLIIMDNAAYHRAPPPGTPRPSEMKKEDLITALRERDLTVCAGDTRNELKERLSLWVATHVKPEVVRLAEKEGHRVLFSPPRFSDLNPIEMVWAFIKGNVGRRHTSDTSFDDVGRYLQEEMQRLAGDHGQHRADRKTRVQAIIDAVDRDLDRQRGILNGEGLHARTEEQGRYGGAEEQGAGRDGSVTDATAAAGAVVLEEDMDWDEEQEYVNALSGEGEEIEEEPDGNVEGESEEEEDDDDNLAEPV